MSLTEQEKAWIERRKNLCSKCIHKALGCILGKSEGKRECIFFDADLGESDYKDAADFEARVALWLVEDTRTGCLRPSGCVWYAKNKRRTQCPPGLNIDKCDRAHCSLYQARLAVEQEMEKQQ